MTSSQLARRVRGKSTCKGPEAGQGSWLRLREQAQEEEQ